MTMMSIKLKCCNGSKPLGKKDFIRFMTDYFKVQSLLEEYPYYSLSAVQLEDVHNYMDDQYDFNFGCLCGTVRRVGKDWVDLSPHFEYYNKDNNYRGSFEVI